MGRAGTRYRFVCADAGRSCACVYGDVDGDRRDEFGRAGAAAAVWHRRAEEKIFAAHGDGGNAGGVLPDGACGGLGRGGNTSKGISAFLVEPGFAGFRVGRHEDKMGQRSSPSVEILLNDCVVPVENRLGEEGQGLKIALSALDGGRIGIAAQAVGLAQGALEETVKYAKQRAAFGKKISEFQAIQWMIADMQTEIEAARGLTHYAAWLKDAHPNKVGASASKAKLYASEMVNRVVYKAVQVHGSAGYSRETDVERMYRDARVITIYEGTSEVQRMIIARELLGKAS